MSWPAQTPMPHPSICGVPSDGVPPTAQGAIVQTRPSKRKFGAEVNTMGPETMECSTQGEENNCGSYCNQKDWTLEMGSSAKRANTTLAHLALGNIGNNMYPASMQMASPAIS